MSRMAAGKTRRALRRSGAMFLALAMIAAESVGGVPLTAWGAVGRKAGSGAEVWARNMKRAVNLGPFGVATPSNAEDPAAAWQGDYLYYGHYREDALTAPETATDSNAKAPVRWRILSNGDSVYGDDAMFLMADQVLDQELFTEDKRDASWEGSCVRTWMNTHMKKELFSKGEEALLKKPKAEAGAEEDSLLGEYAYSNPAAGEQLFLLSYAEVSNPTYGFYPSGYQEDNATRQLMATDYAVSRGADLTDDGRSAWWLRSQDRTVSGEVPRTFNMASIDIDGWYGADMASEVPVNGLAPAFCLDRDKVLLTSLTEGGKPEGLTGEELWEIEAVADDPGNSWKVTIEDEAHKGFRLVADDRLKKAAGAGGGSSTGSRSGSDAESGTDSRLRSGIEADYTYATAPKDLVTIRYQGAAKGSEEQPEAVSVILHSEEENLFYYGRVKEIRSEGDRKGTISFSLPDGLEEGSSYDLLIFNEQYNDGLETDYASGFETVRLDILREREITVEHGAIVAIASPSNALRPLPYDEAPSEGTAYAGYRVKVEAEEAPEDMRFDRWRTTPVNLPWLSGMSERKAVTAFTMPDMDVTMEAAYVNLASPSNASIDQKVTPSDWLAYGDWEDVEMLISNEELITDEDWERLEKGWNIGLTFLLEQKKQETLTATASNAIKEAMEEGEEIGFLFATGISKHTVSRDKTVNRTERITGVVQEIQLTIPMPEESRNRKGYRLLGISDRMEEAEVYDFTWTEGGKAVTFSFRGETNAVYAVAYLPTDNQLRLSCDDAVYGEPLMPEVENNPSDGALTFLYKKKGAPDSELTEEMPVQTGAYTVTARTEETENYEELTASVHVNIQKKKLQKEMVLVPETVKLQNGKAEPEIVVEDISSHTGEDLISENDYEISYENNERPGTGRVIVKATEGGNYKGTVTAEFRIIKPENEGPEDPDEPEGPEGPDEPETPDGPDDPKPPVKPGRPDRDNDDAYERNQKPAAVNTEGTWYQNGDGTWRFLKLRTGTWAESEWLLIKDCWYYFKADRNMQTGWFFDGVNWYYMEEQKGPDEGKMRTGWLLELQDNNWYYLDPETGAMRTGWFWYKGRLYYLTEAKDVIDGWKQEEGTGRWYLDRKDSRPLGSWKEPADR